MSCQFDARRSELTRNLLRVYKRRTIADSTAGATWYPNAHKIVCEWADTYGYSIATVAAVIAAISPQCEWNRNLVIADDLLAGRPPSIGGALQSNIRKARIIRDNRLSDTREVFAHGPKVYHFARNLAGDSSVVTVDTHAVQAALDNVLSTVTLRWTPYLVFADCYARAAERVKVAPADFQAIIWHIWKREHPTRAKIATRAQWAVCGEL